MSSSRKDYYHDKGEQDRSKGKYDPPWKQGVTIVHTTDEMVEENEAYDEGWRNTDKQIKSDRSHD